MDCAPRDRLRLPPGGRDPDRLGLPVSTPYYADDLVTIYHGDCREWMPEADVLVTDPPYGVGLGIVTDPRAGGHGLGKAAYASYADTYDNFRETVIPAIQMALAATKRGAVFSGPHLQDFPKAAAVGGIFCPAGVGRHRWGFGAFLPVLLYGTDPRLHFGARPNVMQSNARAEVNGHPCPKPLSWMRWLIELVSLPDETALDPFMGSGTTLVAAKSLGRRAIGIEIEERYCEIAAQRCSQEVLGLSA